MAPLCQMLQSVEMPVLRKNARPNQYEEVGHEIPVAPVLSQSSSELPPHLQTYLDDKFQALNSKLDTWQASVDDKYNCLKVEIDAIHSRVKDLEIKWEDWRMEDSKRRDDIIEWRKEDSKRYADTNDRCKTMNSDIHKLRDEIIEWRKEDSKRYADTNDHFKTMNMDIHKFWTRMNKGAGTSSGAGDDCTLDTALEKRRAGVAYCLSNSMPENESAQAELPPSLRTYLDDKFGALATNLQNWQVLVNNQLDHINTRVNNLETECKDLRVHMEANFNKGFSKGSSSGAGDLSGAGTSSAQEDDEVVPNAN